MNPDNKPYGKQFQTRIEPGSLRSAREVVPLLIRMVAPESVVDVGCGTGSWLAAFRESGIYDVMGIDLA
ncbi:MAG: class I SAM-dependent methyltransferase, partial [Terriglobales bacterium]